MKIALDISQAQYTGTGVATYTQNLVAALINLKTNHTIIPFGGSLRKYKYLKKIGQDLSPNTKIFPIPPILMDLAFNRFHHLPIELLTGTVDVFHASDWTQPQTHSAKSVTTIHDLTILKFPQHHHQKIIDTHTRRLKWVIKEASAVIADSHATKADIIEELKIPSEKIHVVYLASSPDFLNFAQQDRLTRIKAIQTIKQKHQLQQPFILSVGTNEPRKNLARIIKAFAKLTYQIKQPLNLVIVGRYGWGSELDQIDPVIKKRIKLLGFVDQSDLPSLYRAAEIFVYPSLYEGFGLPVLEAMTVGTPVVTTKKGSLSEVAGSAAILADPYSTANISQAMQQALLEAKDLRHKGYLQAKKFSWEKAAQQTLSVYESLNSI